MTYSKASPIKQIVHQSKYNIKQSREEYLDDEFEKVKLYSYFPMLCPSKCNIENNDQYPVCEYCTILKIYKEQKTQFLKQLEIEPVLIQDENWKSNDFVPFSIIKITPVGNHIVVQPCKTPQAVLKTFEHEDLSVEAMELQIRILNTKTINQYNREQDFMKRTPETLVKIFLDNINEEIRRQGRNQTMWKVLKEFFRQIIKTSTMIKIYGSTAAKRALRIQEELIQFLKETGFRELERAVTFKKSKKELRQERKKLEKTQKRNRPSWKCL